MICSGCGYTAPPLDPRPFRCPNSGNDDVDHVLRRSVDIRGAQDAFLDPEPNPFIRYRRLTHAWSTAMAMGMTDHDYVALVRRLEPQFRVTPLERRDNVWIKDESSNIAGSHKGRHLMGLVIWIEVMKLSEVWLAIEGCGNAALAAATIARAAGRNLDVFVPADAPQDAIAQIEHLGAHVTRCSRRRPSVQLFREAVAGGAFPFTCHANENGLAIEGGQTIGWEIVSRLLSVGETIDRLFVPVDSGALATACIAAFDDARALGLIRRVPRIHAVQAKESPLARAWDKLKTSGASLDYAVHHRSEFAVNETCDWTPVIRGMIESDGFPIVVSEERLSILELKEQGAVRASESVGVISTGRSREA